jgi:uncharacterized protein
VSEPPATPRRVAITGASGFIGEHLDRALAADGWDVHRLVRRSAGPGEIEWRPDRGQIDASRLEGFDAVVHLAGESLLGVWTAAKKERILSSRAQGTRLIAETLARLSRPPGIFISASGVGYYGDAGERILTEESPPGDDFLTQVCKVWEASTVPAEDAGIRVVRSRAGIVLDPSGGALKAMLPAFRLGVGARLGAGRQWLSWITLTDVLRIFRFALDHPELRGPINVCSPQPVRNEEFTAELGRALHRPTVFGVPSFLLKSFTGGMGEVLFLASQRALPAALERKGFRFELPNLGDALTKMLAQG